MNSKPIRFIVSLALPHLAGILGTVFTVSTVSTWYQTLSKPALNPPAWVFGPVWLTLYTLMGIALYFIWQKDMSNWRVRSVFWLFIIHLFFNALWSVLFFGFQNIGLAFLDIAVLWIFILVLLICFWRISKLAFWLMTPYFLWVSFAVYLNCAIWVLN